MSDCLAAELNGTRTCSILSSSKQKSKKEETMDTALKCERGDITQLAVDAIVNSTETSLVGSFCGGVDGAIRRAAGEAFSQACVDIILRKAKGFEIGEVASIKATGTLKSKYVINTFGPNSSMNEDTIRQKLKDCYTNSMYEAHRLNATTVAFPCISTGANQVGRSPCVRISLNDTARIAIQAVTEACKKISDIKLIVFCCHNDETEKAYRMLL